MNTWTSAAKAELERYLAAIRKPLEQAGADAVEVIEDLKRHIEADIAAAQLRVVTVTDLKPMLARIGQPWIRAEFPTAGGFSTLEEKPQSLGETSQFEETCEKLPEKSTPHQTPPNWRRPGYGLLAFGVIYPALTLLIELVTGFCASTFFNPIPSLGHVLLVALLPGTNFYLWRALRNGQAGENARALGVLSAVAMGISVIYSIAFLPLVLPALIALIFFGIGLLPLTPMITAAATAILRKELQQRIAGERIMSAWLGIAVAAIALLLVDFRSVATSFALQRAAHSEDNATAIATLRRFANEATLLKACYPPRNLRGNAPFLFLLPQEYVVTAEQAQKVYFQVYGRPYNSVPPPRLRTGFLLSPELWGERRWDPERGGEKVGARVSGLSMRTSRIDATVEPNAALAYLEWIMEFRNDAEAQAEARCEILLPPDGAVSRLTLWVNGEEREAAFAGRSEVRQAYESVVAQRRDPVLVTSAGRNSILMQCFPVPPRGGVMKVRLGMTVPLQLNAHKDGILRWPVMRERNFAMAEKLAHSFWLDSSQPVASLGIPLTIQRTKSGHFLASGNVPAHSRSVVQPAVLIERKGLADKAWVYDSRGGDGSYVLQTIRPSELPPRTDVVLVLDGSAGVAESIAAFRNVTIPRSMRVVVAGKELEEFTVASSNDWVRVLGQVKFRGGQDNLPALERAWDLAAVNGSGTIIWLRGPQPVLLGSAEGLIQRFERRRSAVDLIDLPVAAGPNVVLGVLPKVARWSAPSMHLPVDQTLTGMLLELSGQRTRHEAIRTRERLVERPAAVGWAESNLHLARAWASDEIDRLVSEGRREEAIEIAGKYQLVSEVSGAVVLETMEQFERAGLQPVDPATVPVVPEPSTWALLIAGLVVLGFGRRFGARKRLSSS